MRRVFAAVVLLTVCAVAQGTPIDPARSMIQVHVGTGGLFGAFAHDHLIGAPSFTGVIDRVAGRVEIQVDARAMRVLDPQAKPSTREEIQRDMFGPKVLDVERFPTIVFRSTSVSRTGAGWTVKGELTLHGVTRPIQLKVNERDGGYAGELLLKQSEYGIKPIGVAGGTVRVKDELKIALTIYLQK